jgi:hypothetical protein
VSKASVNANAVVYAVEQVCALYGVRCTREQSKVITVVGAAGRWRPMFIGQWIDDYGKVHRGGRADILARPRVLINAGPAYHIGGDSAEILRVRVTVPLWIECKSGSGRLSPDQIAFKKWVEANDETYILIHDDVRPLIEWFEKMGVKKEPARVIHSGEPMTVGELHALPCKHCGGQRDNPAAHRGTILACAIRLGKVWSPKVNTTEAK